MAKAPSGGLMIQTYQGAPDGVNLALPSDEILETQARYIQDGLVDKPGLIRRRGPIRNASGVSALTRAAWGMVTTRDPTGAIRYAVLNGTTVNAKISFLSADLTSISAEFGWPQGYSMAPAPIVRTSPSLSGGVWIGTARDASPWTGATDGPVAVQWFGANKATYTTGTVTYARGSSTVTGSGTTWTTNVVPGMYLTAVTVDGFNAYIGVVQKVNSNTSLTLMENAFWGGTSKTYSLDPIRGFASVITKGTITSSSNHAHAHGGDTKWLTQLAANSDLFRARDTTFVGRVTSVQSDFAVTLNANAAVDCADDPYISPIEAPSVANGIGMAPGWITALYASRQWYANNAGASLTPAQSSRVWFSDPLNAESVDTTYDGDWFDVFSTDPQSQPILALQPTVTALLVMKSKEVWGIFGQSPETFTVRLIDSEGCIDPGSIQDFAGGAIWAAREGIKFFDGSRVQNLTTSNLGKYWSDIVKTFDGSQFRMNSMIGRNHYFLFIESCTPSFSLNKSGSVTTPNRITLAINLQTSAVTMMTNLDVRGAVRSSSSTLAPTTYFLVNDSSIGHICSLDDLFDVTGANDSITCTGNAPGPDFFFQGKAHDAGDGTLLKRWRWMEPNALVTGAHLNVDAILGLSEVTHALSDQIPTDSVYSVADRIFLNWDTQYMAIRCYQSSNSVTDVQLGPYELALKVMRVGRPL